MVPNERQTPDDTRRVPDRSRAGRPTRGRSRAALGMAVVALVLIALGCAKKDDGATVRDIGTTSDSASGSGTGKSGSRNASGTAGTGSTLVSGSGASGSSDPKCEPVGNAAEAMTVVKAKLTDFKIEPDKKTVPAGKINFVLQNNGAHPHEVVIVKGDDPAKLPKGAEGGFDEGAYGEDKIIGEVEAFPSGETCNGVFDLAPGSYILLCNVVEPSEHEDHFRDGMFTTFTVT